MKRSALTTIAAALAITACGNNAILDSHRRGSGTLAISQDDAFVYAIDQDNRALVVVDTKTKARVVTIPLGKGPERVVVGPDDRIYVSNALDRSVSVIDRGSWNVRSIATAAGPYGIAVSATHILVACSGAGMLQDFDPATLAKRWEAQVGEDLRGVVLVTEHRALVTEFKKGRVIGVDLDTQRPIAATELTRSDKEMSDARAQMFMNQSNGGSVAVGAPMASPPAMVDAGDPAPSGPPIDSPMPPQVVGTPGFAAHQADDLLMLPDRSGILLVHHAHSTEQISVAAQFAGASAYGQVGMGDSAGGVGPVRPRLTMIDPMTLLPAAADAGHPMIAVPAIHMSAALVDPANRYVAVADRAGSALHLVALDESSRTQVSLGAGGDRTPGSGIKNSPEQLTTGASGLAATIDGRFIFVHDQFDHAIEIFEVSKNPDQGAPSPMGNSLGNVVGPSGSGFTLQQRGIIGSDVLGTADHHVMTPAIELGRKLFFSAADGRMSSGIVSCASCHPGGGNDGHVWQFDVGPRKTLALFGGRLRETAPYHWDGAFKTFSDFETVITQRMGGTGCSQEEFDGMFAYLQTLPAPDNPNVTPDHVLTDSQQRGHDLFFGKADCAGCHGGAASTDNGFHDVGTKVLSMPNGASGDVLPASIAGFNTPTLKSIWASGPYLHDGRAQTLEERLTTFGSDQHGKTTQLGSDEIADLAAYLKTM